MAPRVLALHVNLDQLQRLATIGTVVSFGLAAMFIDGEVWGWWNDAGEVGTIVPILSGVLLGFATLLLRATKGQARTIAVGVLESNRMHDETNRKHDETNRKLDVIVALLTDIRDRLGTR